MQRESAERYRIGRTVAYRVGALSIVAVVVGLACESSAFSPLMQRGSASDGNWLQLLQHQLHRCDEAQLQLLTEGRDNTIAINALWALACRSAVLKSPVVHPERITGLIEGRMRIRCPRHWSARLALLPQIFRDEFSAGLLETYREDGILDTEDDGNGGTILVYCGGGASSLVKRYGNEICVHQGIVLADGEIRVGVTEVPLASEVQEGIRQFALEANATCLLGLNAIVDNEVCYIEVHDGSGRAFPVWCVEVHSGKVLWRAKCGTGWFDFGDDLRMSVWIRSIAVDLRVCDGLVGLYGWDSSSAFFEAFDKKTGTSAAKFSSRIAP